MLIISFLLLIGKRSPWYDFNFYMIQVLLISCKIFILIIIFLSTCLIFQFSSVAQSCLTLCDPMNCSTPGLPVHHQLPSSLKLMSMESVMPSSHLILCHSLLLLPPTPLSIRIFSNESALRMRWPKYWSFSVSIMPSKGHPGRISFRMDWLDLLAVQGTLKSSIPQFKSINSSVLSFLDFSV